jgi:hypothetical protein
LRGSCETGRSGPPLPEEEGMATSVDDEDAEQEE